MAPIPRFAAKPLSIITGALFSALSSPTSSPPSNGTAATVWGTPYTGRASLFDLALARLPSPIAPSIAPTPTTATASPTSVLPPSLVYYDTKADVYTGCDKKTFTASDNVVLMNALQFGDVSSTNTTCGQYIKIQNRENMQQVSIAKVVGICQDCEYGSLDLTVGGLDDLQPFLEFHTIIFDASATLTIADLNDPNQPLPYTTTPISPRNLLNIVWSLTDSPSKTAAPSKSKPSPPPPAPPATTTTPPKVEPPKPSPTKPSGQQFTGRATWFSDTHGQCEHDFSQSDLIVALAEAQMGGGKAMCGKKIRLTMKGSDVEVIATVVDMCPSEHCSSGAVDLSQAAFKKFAAMSVGVLEVQWSFV